MKKCPLFVRSDKTLDFPHLPTPHKTPNPRTTASIVKKKQVCAHCGALRRGISPWKEWPPKASAASAAVDNETVVAEAPSGDETVPETPHHKDAAQNTSSTRI